MSPRHRALIDELAKLGFATNGGRFRKELVRHMKVGKFAESDYVRRRLSEFQHWPDAYFIDESSRTVTAVEVECTHPVKKAVWDAYIFLDNDLDFFNWAFKLLVIDGRDGYVRQLPTNPDDMLKVFEIPLTRS